MITFDYAAFGLTEPSHRPVIPGGGPQTVAEVLDRVVGEDPERAALVGRNGRYTFGELDLVTNRAAHAFCRLGVKPGDRVAACLANDVDIVIAMLATARIGALWVGINRPLAPREKLYMLADSGAVLFLTLPAHAKEVETDRAEVPNLAHIVVSDAASEAAGSGDASFAGLLANAPDESRPSVPIDPFAPAAIAYTSGTTGFPKGATHSQHNMLLPGAFSAATNRYGGLKLGVVLPLNILNLMVLGPLTAFQRRGLLCRNGSHRPGGRGRVGARGEDRRLHVSAFLPSSTICSLIRR